MKQSWPMWIDGIQRPWLGTALSCLWNFKVFALQLWLCHDKLTDILQTFDI